MADPSFALQVALVERLESGLAALDCPVHDGAPLNTPFPYVSIDSSVADDADWLDSPMEQRFVYLSVWSDFKGQQQVLEIMSLIYDLLHSKPLPLSTGRVVAIRVSRRTAQREPDGETYQGAVTLSIKTQH